MAASVDIKPKIATIYYNPRCSKSRSALTLLHGQGYKVEEVRYLENPPTAEELRAVWELLDCDPLDLIRTDEVLFQALGYNVKDQRDPDDWFKMLSKYPKLIQRPIVIINEKAVIARPAELVTSLFEPKVRKSKVKAKRAPKSA
jgi:arsenate reductase